MVKLKKNCVKGAKEKSEHTLWFCLCEVFKQAKLSFGDRNQKTGYLCRQWGLAGKGQ